jgi:hypothetical protein
LFSLFVVIDGGGIALIIPHHQRLRCVNFDLDASFPRFLTYLLLMTSNLHEPGERNLLGRAN